MSTVPNFAPPVYTPRPGAKTFFAGYDGFEGQASIAEDLTILFRSGGAPWYPVASLAELTLFGECNIANTQWTVDLQHGDLAALAARYDERRVSA